MSTYECIAIILSCVALIATAMNVVFYYRLTKEYNALVKVQNKIAQGQAETMIRELIMTARQNVETASEKMAMLNNMDQKKIYSARYYSAQEDLRNSYEEACSRYLDEKVDKDRFKRMYFTEIRQLVESDSQKKYYEPLRSRYECTIKVYSEWFNLEK